MIKKRKKILYLYFVDLKHSKVTTNQFLKTIETLSFFYDLKYFSSWISKPRLTETLKNYEVKKNFSILRLPIFLTSFKIFNLINQTIYGLLSFLIAKFCNYDYIYTRDFSVIYFLSFIPRFLRSKTPVIFESHKIFHKTSKIVSFKQEQRAYKVVDYFVVTSNNCKEDLNQYFDISNQHIVVASNGVDIEHFRREEVDRKILKKYGLQNANKILVYHGSFLWWKGVDDLIKSLHYIKNDNIRLLLIGGYGKDFEDMKELVEKEKLEERVIFTGYLDHKEMIALLHLSDVGILPNNRSEEGERYTSPVKLYEYMACGLPIIASSLDSIKEIIQEPRNCLFFKPEDQRDLALKIESLLSNKVLLDKMSQNNKKDVEEYTWEKKAKKIFQFLDEKSK
jgi:glycosyltransferase involved in cell wall biosynthesis